MTDNDIQPLDKTLVTATFRCEKCHYRGPQEVYRYQVEIGHVFGYCKKCGKATTQYIVTQPEEIEE